MKGLQDIKNRIRNNHSEKIALYRELNNILAGKNIKITCPEFNGQPFGSSKPKLKGRLYKIEYGDALISDGEPYLHIRKPWMGDSLTFDQFEIED